MLTGAAGSCPMFSNGGAVGEIVDETDDQGTKAIEK
jgi:hypothetical protein